MARKASAPASPNALPSLDEVINGLAKKTSDKATARVESPDVRVKSVGNQTPIETVTEEPAGQPKDHKGLPVTMETDAVAEGVQVEGEQVDVEEVAEEVVDDTPPEDDAPPPPKEEPKKDFMAAKFAALSRREKQAREREQELERRQAEVEARLAAAAEREAKVGAAKRPLDILKAHGFKYEDVTEDYLGVYKEPEKDPADVKLDERLSPVTKEMETLKTQLEEARNLLAEFQQERQQRAMQEVDSAIVSTAKENGHECMLAAGDEAVALVKEVITQFYHKNKKVLSYAEACDRVEAYYTDRASKFAETEKIRSKFASASVTPAKQKPASEAKERPNTLTQAHSSGSRAKPNVDEMPKSDALAFLTSQLRYRS